MGILDSKVPAGPLADKWTKHKNDINLVSPANKRNIDIIVVGTGLAGGALGKGVVVDFARHNRRITDLDLESQTVRVGAGVVLDDCDDPTVDNLVLEGNLGAGAFSVEDCGSFTLGAGNVAMDAARTAMRLGAENVKIVYRRSRDEMPARAAEIHHAEEEGIEFHLLTNPTRFKGDDKGRLTGMACLKMELGEPDDSGRRRPIATGRTETIHADLVIMATPIGTMADLAERMKPGLKPGALVTDVGSVKGPIVRDAARLRLTSFVGGHPLAGTERRGFAASSTFGILWSSFQC